MLKAYQGKPDEEKCIISLERKTSMFFFYKRRTVRKTPVICDKTNDDKAFFGCESSRRAGVAILFRNNFDFVLNKDYVDADFRFIIFGIKTANLYFTLVNLFAPNKNDLFFFQNVGNRILEFDYDNIILGGDFNLL